MKILIKSIHLFLFALYVDFYKHQFDVAMDKCIKKGKDISQKRLTYMSNKSYSLYISFKEYEKKLQHDITFKKSV